MKTKNEEKIREFLITMLTSESIFDIVYELDEFLISDEKVKKRVRFKHDNTFITLIKRFTSTYRYWYIRKKFKIKDDNLFFKFSNNTMYHKKFMKNDEVRAITKRQLAFLITHKILIKEYFEIDDDKKSIFYSVDFKRLLDYFKNFHNALVDNPDEDIIKLKLKLKK